MTLRFGPDDQEEFEVASTELVDRFESSAHGAGLGWVADQVLSLKWGCLDGDLGAWTESDVEAILLDLYPRKVSLGPYHGDDVIRGFAGFLQFLANVGILKPSRADRLARLVEMSGAAFLEAMSDDTRFSTGKRLTAAMRADGVDPTDQASVDAWIGEFNDRPFDERDRVLGPALPLVAPPGLATSLMGRMPPVVLAPRAELEERARGALLFERVRRLVDFVGDGRKLTDRGNLTVADGKCLVDLLGTDDRRDPEIGDHVYRTRSSTDLPGVDLAYRLALAAGFLETEGRGRVRTHDAPVFEADPLEAHYRLLLAFLHRVGPTAHHYGTDTYGFGWFADDLDRDLLRVLVELYRAARPIEIDAIGAEIWSWLLSIYDFIDVEPEKLEFHREFFVSSLRRALRGLEELGVVVVADVERWRGEFGSEERGGSVSLSPLGSWALQRIVSKNAAAPVAGALAEATADRLLEGLADLPEDVAKVELDTWLTRHGQDAPGLVVGALTDAGDTARAIGLRALFRIGRDAEPAVARLSEDPEFEAYATFWRVVVLGAPRVEMDARGDSDRFVRLLHAVTVVWEPEDAIAWLEPVAGRRGVDEALNTAWRVRLPETESVLAVLGELHPDKAVAKAARKSLFRFRSSGGAQPHPR